MKLHYLQLNKVPKGAGFPLEVAGYLNMGLEQVPIELPFKGIIIHSADDIVKGDVAVAALLGVKKLPNDVVVWAEDFVVDSL